MADHGRLAPGNTKGRACQARPLPMCGAGYRRRDAAHHPADDDQGLPDRFARCRPDGCCFRLRDRSASIRDGLPVENPSRIGRCRCVAHLTLTHVCARSSSRGSLTRAGRLIGGIVPGRAPRRGMPLGGVLIPCARCRLDRRPLADYRKRNAKRPIHSAQQSGAFGKSSMLSSVSNRAWKAGDWQCELATTPMASELAASQRQARASGAVPGWGRCCGCGTRRQEVMADGGDRGRQDGNHRSLRLHVRRSDRRRDRRAAPEG